MSDATRRRLTLLVGGVILGGYLLFVSWLVGAGYPLSGGSLTAHIGMLVAGVLLLFVWMWLLAAAPAETGRLSVQRTFAAIGIVAVFGLIQATVSAEAAMLPALAITVPLTLLAVLPGRLLAGLLVVVVPWQGSGYFAAVLLAVGLAALPRHAGAYFRYLVPRRVGP